MRATSSEYLQEENRPRGAVPHLKAVVHPFELDYGLAPNSGVFDHTLYGGEPGKLVLESGYITSGAWTSPVMQAFSPHLNSALASWTDQAGYLETRLWWRSAATAQQVPEQTFVSLSLGEEIDLGPYFQMRLEFSQAFRTWALDLVEDADLYTAYGVDQAPENGYESWAVEGEFPGYLADLSLEGRLTLPESEILEMTSVRVELSRDFSSLRSGDLAVVLDNRQLQWLPGAGNFHFLGWPWAEKRLSLYHGWELPNGAVEWLLVYQGLLEAVGGMSHGWRNQHQARLVSRDWMAASLSRVLGGPSPQGERRPFIRGAYLAKADLYQIIPAEVSEPLKEGTGSASLRVGGDFSGTANRSFWVEAETTGEVGVASFRWSTNAGQSWKGVGIITAGPEDPVELEEGVSVHWEGGGGTDLAAGDRWLFTAAATLYHYQVYGGPFISLSKVYLNDAETSTGVETDPETGAILVRGRSAQVTARVVKDGSAHPVDIIAAILAAVGLQETMDQPSFALAKSLTPEYVIGVCFENISAAQALREILGRCLYDLWLDYGQINLRAYLGE